jgi:hypothetical protein
MKRLSGSQGRRGAIIIHVAFALMALLAFTAFVIDYGVMWIARRQAQNVADAAALAGAISMIKDGGSEAQAEASAQHYAANNPIWGLGNSAANVVVTFSKTGSNIPPCGEEPGCVRVDVFRNMPDRQGTVRGAPIPTYFAHLVGLTAQGVRATATAETQAGNNVKCLLPFAVADRWSDGTDENIDITHYANDGDHNPPVSDPIKGWSPNDLYQDASEGGIDFYTPPYHAGHTGWTVAGDFGRQLILKDGEVGDFSAGWSNKVDLPFSTGANEYLMDIKGCNATPVSIAEEDEDCSGFPNSTTTEEMAQVGCLGVSTGVTSGPTDHGVEGGGPDGPEGEPGIVPEDPGAKWSWSVNLGPNGIAGGVVDANGNPNMSSPRIRPIAVFDIAHYMQNPACKAQAGTGCVVKVANIIGFFVEGICDTLRDANPSLLEPGNNCDPQNNVARRQVVGRITTLPAKFFEGGGNVSKDAAFLLIVRLVR